MRVAVPVLVSSLVFCSFIFARLEMANRNSTLSLFNSEYMLSLNSKPKRNQPERPVLHRGTGRRSMLENTLNAI